MAIFGYNGSGIENPGGSIGAHLNTGSYLVTALTNNGSLTKGYGYIHLHWDTSPPGGSPDPAATSEVQLLVYEIGADDVNSPLVAVSNVITLTIADLDPTWIEFTFPGVILEAGKSYSVGTICKTDSNWTSEYGTTISRATIHYDTVTTPVLFKRVYSTVPGIAPPATLESYTGPSATSSLLCVYAEYTPHSTTESSTLAFNAHIYDTETATIISNASIIDPHIFTFAEDSSVTSIENNYNAFDIKLKHICNHNLNTGQYILNTCPRCLGKGYYYDIKFNATGKPIEVSLSDKLAQTLEKFVLTENNDFHSEVAINMQQWLGSSPISEIKSVIKFELSKSLMTLMRTQRGVLNLSSAAQIARIDSIEVFENPNDSCTLDYTVTITTVAGDTKELTGTLAL